MDLKLSLRKQFIIALYSSTAIGFITLGPVYITIMYSANIIAPETMNSLMKLSPFSPAMIVLFGTIFISIITFMFWTIIIMYSHLIDKYSVRISNKLKLLTSYLICLAFFLFFREVMQLVIHLFFKNLEFKKISYIAAYNTSSFGMMKLIIMALFTLSVITVIFIIHNLIMLKQKEMAIESENAQLRINNIEATYQQLKQQIHPHFLFNSLNTLKTLIRKQPAKAESYLKQLSDYLRTSITLEKKDVVSLDDELKFCINYLEMQKVRFGDALEFIVKVPDEARTGFVPVFAIQQLLENAIKHNALTKESPLVIEMEYRNGRIIVSNNMKDKDITQESTGMGLTNLAERYRLLSGDEVIINTNWNNFSVSLKILEHENSDYRG